ncbi:MAG TPA: DUF4139 domain-containing protein [Bryobacteraceae bacterium]|jgi:hypothetical protein
MRPKILLISALCATSVFPADFPVQEVILYKHGVAYFERAGDLQAGETARLDFKAEDMNDVLKSLTITDRSGAKIGGIRYDASEPLEKRLQDFPFAVGNQASLPAFLDQMKGARLELKVGPETVAGTIVSARVIAGEGNPRPVEREIVVLLTDSGDIRTIDLNSASSVRLSDPKLQTLLKDYLTVLNGARSKDKRSVYIDASSTGTHQMVARYMTPAAVWKSSYRLIFGTQGEPMLEGWAIVDNTSGEDWDNVKLSVVSGRPISFISQLYEPRYVQRPTAELAENRAIGPQVFQGSIGALNAPAPAPPPAVAMARQQGGRGGSGSGGGGGGGRGVIGGFAGDAYLKSESGTLADTLSESTIASVASGQDLGELFEYSFPSSVTVKKGQSAMLPFLQQRLNARKLLIYTDNMDLHPMNAAELTNTTGKTLDGGPITVYDAGAYAGEALVETLKAADKRLISYGVDLGTRISTVWDSSRDTIREIHLRRGVLTTRSAAQETRTYTIKNVDAQAKTLIIEHPERPGYKLLNQTPSEKTSNAYRFEVKVNGSGTATFPLQEERVYDQTTSVASATPDILNTWIQNKALSDAGRLQLQQIAQKKSDIAANDTQLAQTRSSQQGLTEDQNRLRQNIQSLNAVAGQQDQVQVYARQLAAGEAKFAILRDTQSQLERRRTQLQSELNSLIEKADF